MPRLMGEEAQTRMRVKRATTGGALLRDSAIYAPSARSREAHIAPQRTRAGLGSIGEGALRARRAVRATARATACSYMRASLAPWCGALRGSGGVPLSLVLSVA